MSEFESEKVVHLSDEQGRLLLVQDQLQPCPYLQNVTARMPLSVPVGPKTPDVTDQLLSMGYRRSGEFVYNTACPACQACQPTRLDVHQFQQSASMRRVWKRGKRDLRCAWGKPRADAKRVWLFNQHRNARGLCQGTGDVDLEGYRMFLVDSCCHTIELSIWLEHELVAVSIVDAGDRSLSAVYTHFDPHAMRYSLGTYALLEQIEYALSTGRKYLYLGMYVEENRHLNYKARFKPQQRLIDGRWRNVNESDDAGQDLEIE